METRRTTLRLLAVAVSSMRALSEVVTFVGLTLSILNCVIRLRCSVYHVERADLTLPAPGFPERPLTCGREYTANARGVSRHLPRGDTRDDVRFVPPVGRCYKKRGRRVMSVRHDAIVIGAGHNGRVAAAYLARAGRRVLVLERRPLVGGACVTEDLWPGFKVSTAAYVTSLLRPEIIRDLGLERHGLQILPRSPSSFTPFPDGRYLLMGPDREWTRREVAKFSRRDADALPRYEAMLERMAALIEPTLLMTPPNPWSRSPKHLLPLTKLGLRFLKLGGDGAQAVEILTGA